MSSILCGLQRSNSKQAMGEIMLPGRTGLARDSHPGRPIRSRKEPAHALSVFQNSISWSVQPELEFERASPYLDDTTPASSHRQHAWSCVLCRPRWYPGGAVRPSCSELIARIIWFRIACYPSGRGICLPLRHLIMGAEPGPGCCCCYPTGRCLRLLLRHLIMDAELELNCCCYCTVARPLRRHKDSTTPAYLAVSCRLAWGGGRGTGAATTIICFGRRSGGGWAGRTAAAAGSRLR